MSLNIIPQVISEHSEELDHRLQLLAVTTGVSK